MVRRCEGQDEWGPNPGTHVALAIRRDRDIHIVLPESLKVAVKRLGSSNDEASANIITMCG